MAMNVSFLRGLSTSFKAEGFSPVSTTFYFLTDTSELYLGSVLLSNEITAAQFEALEARVKTLEDADFQGQIDAIREELKSFGTSETITRLEERIAALEEWKAALPEYVEKTVYDAHLTAQSEKDAAQDAAIGQALTDAKAYTDEEIVGLEFALSEDGKTLELKNKAGTAVATLDTSDFVVDGMLSSVVADQENNKLTFTWNTDSGIQVTEIELSSIADIYKGSDGAEVKVAVSNENVISATLTDTVKADIAKGVDAQGRVATLESEMDAAEGRLDVIERDYAKTADVTSAIATAKGEAIADADAKLANKLDTSVHTEYVEAHKDDYTNAKVDELVADAKKAGTDASAAAGAVADRVTALEGRMPAEGKTIATTDDVATATADMATQTHVADNYVAKEGYVAFTSEEKTKLASLENYDDTELAGRVGAVEAKPAMGITAEQITAWDNEVGAKELAGQKATLAEVKDAYIGDTNAKLVDVVKAVNMLAEGSEATDDVVETIVTNVKDIEAQLTWGTF